MTNITYSIKKGEKYPINVTLRNHDDDKPIDLTNAVIKVQLKDELKDEFFILEKTITTETDIHTIGKINNPENGAFVIRFTDEDYEKLVCERLYFMTITWNVEDEYFSKVISSNCGDYLIFKVCYP